ncbi:MAG: site-specific integrase [Acidobacteriota bacterium]
MGEEQREKHRGIYRREGSPYLWLRYADAQGKMRFESAGTTSMRKAISLLADKRHAVGKGEEPSPERVARNVLFSELADKFLEWAPRLRSFDSVKYRVSELTQEFGSWPVRSIRVADVEAWMTRKQSTGVRPATTNRLLSVFKRMLAKGEMWNTVMHSQLDVIRKVKPLPGEEERERYMSYEEEDRLLAVASPHLREVIQVAVHTGLRRGELLALKWEDVDLERSFLRVRTSKNDRPRSVPLDGDVKAVLSAMLSRRRLDVSDVFTYKGRGGIKGIKTAWNKACRKAGISDLHFHDLRHTFASRLVQAGVSLYAVAKLLGHSKATRVTERYAHLAPEGLAEDVKVLERRNGAALRLAK